MWEGFFTGYLNYGLNCREKNEEIISWNSLPHYKRASSFTNKREAAWLHLLPNLSRYRRMSESVHHDEQGSSLHDRWCLRYDKQCSSLHAEGLNKTIRVFKFSAHINLPAINYQCNMQILCSTSLCTYLCTFRNHSNYRYWGPLDSHFYNQTHSLHQMRISYLCVI